MAIQPIDRPAGTAHVLRFTGNIAETANTAIGAFPKPNGEYPSGPIDGAVVGVRFLLASTVDGTDMAKRFPSHVYDDAQPAAASPHAAVASTPVAGVVGAVDMSIALRTWAQSLKVRVLSKAVNILTVDVGAIHVILDTATGGLGTNSGLPVVVVPMTFTDNQLASAIDITFEIPASGSR